MKNSKAKQHASKMKKIGKDISTLAKEEAAEPSGYKRGGKIKAKKSMKVEGGMAPKRLDKPGRGFDTTDAGVSPAAPMAKNALKKGGKC